MPLYMLDTNALIQLRRNEPSAVSRRMATLPAGDAVMSVVTYGELSLGVEKSREIVRARAVLSAILTIVPVASLPTEAGTEYGYIRADLERRGEIIGPNDLWIAAHARAARLTLVTANEREFRRVPGLRIENWAQA